MILGINTGNHIILRITIAVLMLFHGVAKLSNLNGIKNMLAEAGLPELIAPLLILVGFRTRLASVVFFFGMITAILLAHSENIFSLSKTGGLKIELILLYAFGALVFFFTGSRKYAVSTSNKWD